jgi:SAM-dependent methyltransferase
MADAAPDGSPVDLYVTLPPVGEPELVHASVPTGAEILELGSGAGRITHGLVALGHPVVAVDQSSEMLSHVRGAEKVRADIEGLSLGRTFPVVLLASNLVNTVEDDRRCRFLATCRRHVSDDGVVIVQRLDPSATWDEAGSNIGEVRVRTRDVRREGSLVSATVEYRTGDKVWRHPFTCRILDDAALDEALADAGLLRRRLLDKAPVWVEAVPHSRHGGVRPSE